MDTVNGLNAAQIEELLQPLEDGPHIKKETDGKFRLRHEYIRARLTQIYGFNGWGEQDLECTLVHESTDKQAQVTVVAYRARQRLIIRNADGSVRTFYDGAGAWGTRWEHTHKATIWDIHSDAMNGARSVALCRAVMNLGPQFGLALWTDEPATAVVGYSLPHQPLTNIYRAGDIDPDDPDEMRQGSP